MKQIRIGLIGFGLWVRNSYLPALQYDNRTIITAVTAATENTRRLAHKLLGDKVIIFQSYEELLNYSELDAVMIAVPDRIHHLALSAAIDAGIPVFYEPPIADTRDHILSMINCLVNAPQISFADLELGYHPVIARSVQLIAQNAIGLLHNVAISLNANWGANGDSDICLLDHMACWYIDLLNHIIGSMPERVLVLDGYGNTGRKQTISTGIFDYSGIWGILKANITSSAGLSLNIEITGDKGEIDINFMTGELLYRSVLQPDWKLEICTPLQPYAEWPGVREAVSAFLDAVITPTAHRGNASTVAKLSLIGLALEKSKDTRDWVTIL